MKQPLTAAQLWVPIAIIALIVWVVHSYQQQQVEQAGFNANQEAVQRRTEELRQRAADANAGS